MLRLLFTIDFMRLFQMEWEYWMTSNDDSKQFKHDFKSVADSEDFVSNVSRPDAACLVCKPETMLEARVCKLTTSAWAGGMMFSMLCICCKSGTN